MADSLNQSAYWHQQGNSAKALAYAQQALNIQSNSADAWFVLGNAWLLKNNYAIALEETYGLPAFEFVRRRRIRQWRKIPWH